MSDAIQLPPLNEECQRCHGTGTITTKIGTREPLDNPQPCYVCEQRGTVPTAAGKAILDLLESQGITRR